MMRSVSSLLQLGLRLGFVCVGVSPLGLVAQQADEGTRNWGAKGELGGSAFFGNTSQSALTAALSGEVGLGFTQLDGRTGFAYGRAANEAGGGIPRRPVQQRQAAFLRCGWDVLEEA